MGIITHIKGSCHVKHLAECPAHDRCLLRGICGCHHPLTLCKWLVKAWKTGRKVALLIAQLQRQTGGELQRGRLVVRAR